MSKHGYIYGSGMAGCLYDNGPHWASTLDDAIEDLRRLFDYQAFQAGDEATPAELEAEEAFWSELRECGIAAFPSPSLAGAHYAEISEADYAAPPEPGEVIAEEDT